MNSKNTFVVGYLCLLTGVLFCMFLSSFYFEANKDPLPSWNNNSVKMNIIRFVTDITNQKSENFIFPSERIAVFDDDGTLWQEAPTVELMYTLACLKKSVQQDTNIKHRQPFKAALEGDKEYLKREGIKAVAELMEFSHYNRSLAQFQKDVTIFLDTARHPKWKKSYQELTYKPMLELIQYLRANQFEVWICSGGTTNFMRVFSEEIYGVPKSQVIGTDLKMFYKKRDDMGQLWIEDSILFINDKENKPVGINNHIGRIPVIAVGNERSGGDIFMLTYSQSLKSPSLQMLINHDDGVRESYYQERDSVSLKEARNKGWRIVSIKNDWKEVFPK